MSSSSSRATIKEKKTKMAFSCVWTLLRWAFFLAILAWIIQYWLTTKTYLFSEEEVAAIAKKHVGPAYRDAYSKIHQEFQRRYPGHILPAKDLQWIFVNAGGWMGSMCLLHASLTEYVLFFGTALDTTGHSGRYWANVSDTILTGSFKQWPEGTTEAITYKPGSKHEDAFRKIHSDFSKRYPGHILLTRDLQWVFVNIGGYMTSSCIVHASMTESIVFSGSPVQALGHAGWHWTNVSQTLITGNMKVWPEGTTKIVSYKPGETIHNTWGTSLGTEVAAGTWFVGYNRGFIPSAIGHAIADTIFNTHDFVTLFHTIRAYTKALWLEASHYIGQARDFGRKHST